jgi:antitoxin component YwqK of YwqJK toxin-antitoxin module
MFLRCLLSILAVFFLAVLPCFAAERWYESDAAGMALRPALSVVAAHDPYSLWVEDQSLDTVPGCLRKFYQDGWTIQRRLLFNDGSPERTQYVFFDNTGTARFDAAWEADGSGLAEIFNEHGQIETEYRYAANGSGFAARFTYSTGDGPSWMLRAEYTALKVKDEKTDKEKKADDETNKPAPAKKDGRTLIVWKTPAKAVASWKEPALTAETGDGLWEDIYYYNRAGGLRAVRRSYSGKANGEKAEQPVSMAFPRTMTQAAEIENFVQPSSAYNTPFLQNVISAGEQSVFTTDDRGRVLTQTIKDKDGKEIGVFSNTWDENRVTVVDYKPAAPPAGTAAGDELKVEYTYDADANRISEKDLRNGKLEREVSSKDGTDTEKLYVDEKLVMTALWKNGVKVSETQSIPGEGETSVNTAENLLTESSSKQKEKPEYADEAAILLQSENSKNLSTKRRRLW